MADWASRYAAALDARDVRETKHKRYIDAYTRLADRKSAAPAVLAPAAPQTPGSPSPRAPGAELARLRADLGTTQRTRVALEAQVAAMSATHDALDTAHGALQASHGALQASHGALQRANRLLERRLKDRDEELREKRRLVGNVQDEMVGLNMELNVMGREMERLKAENGELVRRWVERMGDEVEEMNLRHAWG